MWPTHEVWLARPFDPLAAAGAAELAGERLEAVMIIVLIRLPGSTRIHPASELGPAAMPPWLLAWPVAGFTGVVPPVRGRWKG